MRIAGFVVTFWGIFKDALKMSFVLIVCATLVMGGYALWRERMPLSVDDLNEQLTQKGYRPSRILEIPELLIFDSPNAGEAAVDIRDWRYYTVRMHRICTFRFNSPVQEIDVHRKLDALEIETGLAKVSLLAFSKTSIMVMCSFESVTSKGHFRRHIRAFVDTLDYTSEKVHRAMRELAQKNLSSIQYRVLEVSDWPMINHHFRQIPDGIIQKPPFSSRN